MANSRDIIKDIKLMQDYTDVGEMTYLESDRIVDGLFEPVLVVIAYDEGGHAQGREAFRLVKVED